MIRKTGHKDRGAKLRAIVIVTLLGFVLVMPAGCGGLVAPHQAGQAGTSTTVPSSGIDKKKFSSAWDKLKDIRTALATATALAELRSRVEELREALDVAGRLGLREEEKQVWMRFHDVYLTYKDSIALWDADLEVSDPDTEGIPLYRDGEALLPRADEIVALYGLELGDPQGVERLECVPDDTINRLWGIASRLTEEWLLPVLR